MEDLHSIFINLVSAIIYAAALPIGLLVTRALKRHLASTPQPVTGSTWITEVMWSIRFLMGLYGTMLLWGWIAYNFMYDSPWWKNVFGVLACFVIPIIVVAAYLGDRSPTYRSRLSLAVAARALPFLVFYILLLRFVCFNPASIELRHRVALHGGNLANAMAHSTQAGQATTLKVR